jgi:hypothetical protein
MRTFFTAFAGGFIGKIAATLFVAVCLVLGFGPDKWAAYLVSWISPELAQLAFLALGFITFVFAFGPSIILALKRIYLVAINRTDEIPTEIKEEFESARSPILGQPIQSIKTTTGVYQAAHEHAMVIVMLPILDVFVLPTDRERKAIRAHVAAWLDDRKWFEDAYLRNLFCPPEGKNPPEFRGSGIVVKKS